jgi:ectoine hydroxylase-related dioxygenase (phytanoyl-CoA dioxygenase family)
MSPPEHTQRYLATVNPHPDLDAIPKASIGDVELRHPDFTLAQARAVYDRWGCVVVRDLLPELVPAIVEDTEAMAEAVRASGFQSKHGALIRPGDHTGRPHQIQLFYPTYVQAASTLRAAVDPRMASILGALIGPNVELHSEGMLIYKEPGGGMEKSLHQDAPYFYHRDHSFCSAFLHLVPTNQRNGRLQIMPGSHELGLLEHEDLFSHMALPPAKYPLDLALGIDAEPGDVVFFNYFILHGSDRNWSDRPRPALIMQYRAAEDVQLWESCTFTRDIGVLKVHKPSQKLLVCGRRAA